MASTRNKDEDDDTVPDQILDAARELVLAVGVTRTTATDVARKAGISRMTFYRRFADMQRVLADLLTRELSALIAAAALEVDAKANARQRLCSVALGVVRSLADDELFARVLDVDPELLLPYVIDRTGASQWIVLSAITRALADGRGDGSIRPCELEPVARTVLLTVQSFVLSARILVRESNPEAAFAELGLLLDRYLAP
ncbi:MAG: TetR/AcrR family transcriptional regulator [Mycobacteriaceae bacterium]